MAGLSKRARELVRPEVARLAPYDPGFAPCKVNLSANENTYGLPREAREAIDRALLSTPTNRYPDPMANGLRDAIGEWYGVNRENVCVGNGGDELLFNTFLAFGGPGRLLVDCAPSFEVYTIYSQMLGTTVRRCWRDPETFEIDMDVLLPMASSADIVVVTSPNNPTGNLFSREDVKRLCREAKGVVLIDEAYIEFADPSARCDMLLASLDNLVVLHTFSKAFSMAGVRLGYVLSSADLISVYSAVRQPYTVDVFAQATAEAVVRNRRAFDLIVARIKAERERFKEELEQIPGMRVWPSASNFLLVRVRDAGIVRARLRDEYSILVRDFSAKPGLEDCLRITVGNPEEDDLVIKALAEICKEA